MTNFDRIVLIATYILSGVFMYMLGKSEERAKNKMEEEGRYDLYAEGSESDW